MRKKYNLIQNSIYVMCGVWKYNRLILLLIIANTVVTAVSPFIGILFPRQILDELLTAKRPERLCLLLIAFFLAATAASYFTQYLKGIFMAQPVKVVTPYANKMYQKCMDISFQCTEDPDFLNSVRPAEKGGGWSNYDGISGMLHKWFEAPGAVIALCGYIAIVSKLNVLIRLYLACSIGVIYVLSLVRKKYEHSKRDELVRNERRSNYLYDIMYDFSYGKEIRLHGLSDWLGSRFMLYRDKIRSIKESVKNFEMFGAWVDIFFSLVREGIVYAYLVYLVAENRMTIADFSMYAAAIAGFKGAFERAARQLADMYGLSMQISDYRIFMSRPDEMTEEEEPVPIPSGPYEFEFRNVSWRYPGSSLYIFRHLNLTIPKGRRLALVGNNGAGKTTFIKLLCRLYRPEKGCILLNGVDINEFEEAEYSKLLSVIFQDYKIFSFSVGENLTFDEPADEDRIRASLGQAGILKKIEELPLGIGTPLYKNFDKNGVELSGGEMQKIAIARALYKNAPLVVLDEPTAALDPYSEYEVYSQFGRMSAGKTTIYISHRLSSCRFCDAVAVFDNGALVEYGSHEQLVCNRGLYAEMWEAQAQYYQ